MLDRRITFKLGIRRDFSNWVASANRVVVTGLAAGAPPFSTSEVALDKAPLPSAPNPGPSALGWEVVASVVELVAEPSWPFPTEACLTTALLAAFWFPPRPPPKPDSMDEGLLPLPLILQLDLRWSLPPQIQHLLFLSSTPSQERDHLQLLPALQPVSLRKNLHGCSDIGVACPFPDLLHCWQECLAFEVKFVMLPHPSVWGALVCSHWWSL